jgi:hypothetical protein
MSYTITRAFIIISQRMKGTVWEKVFGNVEGLLLRITTYTIVRSFFKLTYSTIPTLFLNRVRLLEKDMGSTYCVTSCVSFRGKRTLSALGFRRRPVIFCYWLCLSIRPPHRSVHRAGRADPVLRGAPASTLQCMKYFVHSNILSPQE